MKLLYIVNVDWFFISHRLPIALAAIENGYEVHLICENTGRKKELEQLGIVVHPVNMTRSGTNFIDEVKAIIEIYAVVKRISPDVVHLVTIKGVLYGGIVTRVLRTESRVVSISGLGYTFIDQKLKTRILRFFIIKLYRFALKKDNTNIIFQNESDKSIFIKNGIASEQNSLIIRGSGVDLNKFTFKPEPNGPQVVMFLARLLKDKGVIEFCDAALKVVEKVPKCRFVLVGDLDPNNPNSLSAPELARYIEAGVVEHWGYSNNVEKLIHLSNIVVLPSYREGLPKSLIEAAACGRAVVTTDVPGCRDAIIDGKTGLLVPPKSVIHLVEAISELLTNESLRSSFSYEGRLLAESLFDINDVIGRHLDIYRM